MVRRKRRNAVIAQMLRPSSLVREGERPAAQADVAAPAVHREPLHPAPAAAGRDDQVQRRAGAVAVAAGLSNKHTAATVSLPMIPPPSDVQYTTC